MNYRTARSAAAAAGDALLWLLIVVVGLVALSPLAGLAAAREVVAVRRRLREQTAAMPSGLWARQVRRNAPLPAWRSGVQSAVNPGP
jgi:hypothetical protein